MPRILGSRMTDVGGDDPALRTDQPQGMPVSPVFVNFADGETGFGLRGRAFDSGWAQAQGAI